MSDGSRMDSDTARFDRRSFLWAAAALPVSVAAGTRGRGRISGNPFALGVASGDPEPDGVVLWTRLAPDPLHGGSMPPEAVDVTWEVAEDEAFRRIVRRGTVTARPDAAHSVHVEVEGLQPDRWYWYRFHAAGVESPVGRTRTMPEPGAWSQRLRFAFASCQHYETGLFTAYEHMAREDLDLVVHLGDYIYEGAGRADQVRKHVGPHLKKLGDYRNRYAQYRTDPSLQAMHAAAPWIVTWDDHEFANNYANLISERAADKPEEFRARRAHAYQAYWEHMPLRRRSRPRGPDMRLYRRLPYGQLAEFLVLDTRQYRTDQPCGDGNKPPCPESYDPRGTLLGGQQRAWLFDRLGASEARWNVLAQQVMLARVDRSAGEAVTHSMDQWPGYEYERRRLLQFLADRRIANPVVLTGDIHTNWANELLLGEVGSRVVGAEFVGTSISSGGNGTAVPGSLARLMSENPFVKYHNAQRGYVRCDISEATWRTDFRVVPYVTRPGAPVETAASFLLEAGRPELHRI